MVSEADFGGDVQTLKIERIKDVSARVAKMADYSTNWGDKNERDGSKLKGPFSVNYLRYIPIQTSSISWFLFIESPTKSKIFFY